MQPLNILRHLKKDFIDYISSKYPFAERSMIKQDKQLRDIMGEEGVLFQDPVLQIVRSRKKKKTNLDSFHPLLRNNGTLFETPYVHQVKAWENIQSNTPTVVATGTGSGKSEGFIFPVIDGLLKNNFQNQRGKIGAIFLYPMNALVEDQFFRIIKYAKKTGIRVGIYNGTFKKPSKAFKEKIITKIQKEIDPSINAENLFVDPSKPDTIPHILLTNYKMLEYMLLRSSDQALFENIDLKYLVLDEAHIYTGTLGLEISCLLARLQVHLGNKAKDFLPVATSATLLQISSRVFSHDEKDHVEQMRLFFTQLFGKEFPKNKEWLLQDDYEPLTPHNKSTFSRFSNISDSSILAELEKNFPYSLIGLSKLLLGIDLSENSKISPEEQYRIWGTEIFPQIKDVAKELPSVLLINSEGREVPVVKYSKAQERFKERVGGSPVLLEALLILSSHSFETVKNDKFPSIGLRVHVFSKPEPKVYWTFDKEKLFSERGFDKEKPFATDFISCIRCGHQAWGAVYTPVNQNGGTSGELKILPPFYEEQEFENGEEIILFHDSSDIDDTNFEKPGWNYEEWSIFKEDDKIKATPAARRPDAPFKLLRVTRSVKDRPQPETHTCPACGETSGYNEKAILGTQRSSASTDLSIYGASVLTNTDLSPERRLLLFCDNRQETAFLAGFLTDRHRRLNLRRAIGTFLNEASLQKDTNNWSLLKEIDPKAPRGHQYDLAARILLSIKEKKYCGNIPLPEQLEIDKKLLIDLIPRDMLEIDWIDRRDSSTKEEREYKNWLMENTIASETRVKLEDARDTQELFNSDRGKWCLELFTKVLIIEMTAVMSRDSSLPNSGILAWGLDGFNPDIFEKYAKEHPEFCLGPKEMFFVAHWLFKKLASRGLWNELDDHTIRHVLGRSFRNQEESFKTLLGKGLGTGKGLSPNSQIYRLLKEYGTDKNKIIEIWSKPETWITFIEKSPLEQFIQLRNANLTPVIKGRKAYITGIIDTYCASKSGKIATAPKGLPFNNAPTGIKGEIWELSEIPQHDYYRNLYLRTFKEESRLIRATEHNGMLGPQHANQVIEDFSDGKINTLVATPTLEMGVDLPDLPVVIHRSVPPDPSNYAQRAGRAGRDPKRALILTHCGYRSHDLVFYESPEMMVAGEILPPGLPSENDSIIKRHIQGLILELMAIPDTNFENVLQFVWWGDLVNLNDLKKELISLSNDEHGLEDSSPIDWRKILDERRGYIKKSVERFILILSDGLWSDLKIKRPQRFEVLRRKIMQLSATEIWAQSFSNECQRYRSIISWHLKEILNIKKDLGSVTSDLLPEKSKLIARLENIARSYLKRGMDSSNNHTYPITYLASSGFLPNFDFPGATTRFVGTIDQLRGNDPRQNRNEFTLTYDRSSSLALREFAPEQTVYGQGFVYKVDRYLARSADNEDDNKKWGVCLRGCTQLTEPGNQDCQFCGADLVHYGENRYNFPKLIEIQQAQGYQEEVISDKRPQRKHHFATQDIRKLGVPIPDESFFLTDCPDIKIKRFLTTERQVKTVNIMCSENTKEQELVPVFKEIREGNIFGVKLKINEDERENYEAFIPSVFSRGQSIVLKLPIGIVLQFLKESVEEEVFYHTFSEIIARSCQRVLRLNKRNQSLRIILDKIHSKTTNRDDKKYDQIDIMFLDTEEGGSGVIELIWDYWDEILAESEKLAKKQCCDSGCYECIKSYDNQRVHDLLNKGIFKFDSEHSIFSYLMRFKDNEHKYSVEDVEVEQEVDNKSPIEALFKKFLDNNSFLYKTQESVFSISGREITRPDFVIKDASGEEISVFLDGKEYHAEFETMLADIEKRNAISKMGRRVISLPGYLFSPILKEDKLLAIFRPLQNKNTKITFATTNNPPPLTGMDWVTINNLNSESLNIGQYKSLDINDIKKTTITYLDEERAEILRSSLEYLGEGHLPVAIQEDVLLFPVNGKDIFADESKKKWSNYLVLTSIFAGLGYRVMGVWIGPRQR